MDESLLIAIFVPTTDETGKDFNGQRGERAVGYPVGKGLILTAGRVFEPGSPYYRDKRYPVTLCRRHDGCDDDSDWIEIPEDNIKWRGKDDLDAALIYCDRLLDIVNWGIVSNEKPPPDCMGRHGELLSTVKGVSGMPVFVGRKIFGIVQSIPPNSDANKLYATPTWKLLENTAFRKEIGYDEQTALAKKIKSKLVKELRQSPTMVDALIDQEPLGIGNDVVGLDAEQRIERLVERLLLLKTDTGAVIKALYGAYDSLDKSGEQGEKAAEILVNAAQLIMPAIYDYGVVQWTRSQQAAPLVTTTCPHQNQRRDHHGRRGWPRNPASPSQE